MGATTHLAWRAALAIVLMVSFYGFALLIIALLVAIPLGLIRVNLGLGLQVGLVTLAAAYGILRSIFPRRERFEAPGPRITPKDQPLLFQEIRRIARAVGQPEPAEVYVIPQANAFVGQRGGFMGLGSRRIMGVGLPLMQILTVTELRGVLAHEFGHFHGGDVAISPWVRGTSAALGRTLQELEDHSQVLMAPFVWYANLFFRLSYKVSRHQELLADQLAAGVAGARSLASALQQSDHAEMLFFFYWQSTVEPVLDAGFRPPLAEGFGAFLQSPMVQRRLAESLQGMEEAEQPRSPHDTHPPLEERLSALDIDPSRTQRDTGPKALSLLHDLVTVETQLAAMSRTRPPTVSSKRHISLDLVAEPRTLTPIAWEEVGAKVLVPNWQRIARNFGRVLEGVTPASLPELEWKHPGTKLLGVHPDGDPLAAADGIVGITLGVALSQAGFTVECPPGEEPIMVGPGERVHVFTLRERLSQGLETPESWRAFCTRTGIADVDLGQVARPAPTPG